MGWDKCQAFNSAPGGNALVNPGSSNTIAGFTNANVVTLASPVSNTEPGTAGCVVWGHLDDAGADAFDTALQAALQCPKVMMAGNGYFFSRPHFFTVPASCSNLPFTFPNQSSLGNLLYAAGYEFEGRGAGNTVWWLNPNFPGSGACTHGLQGAACFQIPVEGRWSQFSITGGNDNSQESVNLIEIDGPASLDNFTVTNWAQNGATGNGVACITIQGWVMMYQVQNTGCGNIGIRGSGGNSTLLNAYKLSVENVKQWGINVNWAANSGRYSSTIYDLDLDVTTNNGIGIVMGTAGAAIKLYHPNIYVAGFTPAVAIGIQCNAACTNDIEDGNIAMGGAATQGTPIFANAVAMTSYLKNVGFSAIGSHVYIDTAAGVLIDEGGNSGFNSSSGTALLGQVVNESLSANVVPVTAAKLVLSAGWGSTAAWTALSGGDAPIQGTITNSGTGQAASPTITYTFPTPYLVAPFSCTATQVGGTNTTLPFTSSALTKTGVTFTATGTPTAAATEIVQIACVTP